MTESSKLSQKEEFDISSVNKGQILEALVEQLGEKAVDCLLALLRQHPVLLSRQSALFLEIMQLLWAASDITSCEIWQELEERMALSEELLKRGIRARKGGCYRSTKLP